jgi:hypothetical protein
VNGNEEEKANGRAMPFLMVALRRLKSGAYAGRKAIPKDVRDDYERLYGQRWEAKFSLPAAIRDPPRYVHGGCPVVGSPSKEGGVVAGLVVVHLAPSTKPLNQGSGPRVS